MKTPLKNNLMVSRKNLYKAIAKIFSRDISLQGIGFEGCKVTKLGYNEEFLLLGDLSKPLRAVAAEIQNLFDAFDDRVFKDIEDNYIMRSEIMK